MLQKIPMAAAAALLIVASASLAAKTKFQSVWKSPDAASVSFHWVEAHPNHELAHC